MKTIFISSSKNNIFIVVTNNNGQLLFKDSGGKYCKRGSERKTPKVAEKMLKRLEEYLEKNSIQECILKYRNHRYTDKGKVTKQLRLILKSWSNEVLLKEIIDANKIIKTAVRYKSRRRV